MTESRWSLAIFNIKITKIHGISIMNFSSTVAVYKHLERAAEVKFIQTSEYETFERRRKNLKSILSTYNRLSFIFHYSSFIYTK